MQSMELVAGHWVMMNVHCSAESVQRGFHTGVEILLYSNNTLSHTETYQSMSTFHYGL